jgi:hypothetical protein
VGNGLRHRGTWLIATVAACFGCACGSASAYAPAGSDFRISNAGVDGESERISLGPDVAFNSTDDEYLVIWNGDGLSSDQEFEISGQLVSTSGAELGADFRITNAGIDGTTRGGTQGPSLAYNSSDNEYLVVWQETGSPSEYKREIFGQRLDADGGRLGGAFRISTTGADGDAERASNSPVVAYNSASNEYLVAWHGDGLATDDEYEIFGQRIAGDGTEIGQDFRISDEGPDGNATRRAVWPALDYNPATDTYLAVWEGDGLGADGEIEISGQLLDTEGAELGSDFRISHTGRDGDTTRDGFLPSVAANASSGEYLVTWHGDGLDWDNHFEIFGQRISPSGGELGSDLRISATERDALNRRETLYGRVAYSSVHDEYLAVWVSNGFEDEAGATGVEILGQRLSAGGVEIDSDFAISDVGDGGDGMGGPGVAFGPSADQYLVTWHGNELPAPEEVEVFGHLLEASPTLPPPDPPDPGPEPPDPPGPNPPDPGPDPPDPDPLDPPPTDPGPGTSPGPTANIACEQASRRLSRLQRRLRELRAKRASARRVRHLRAKVKDAAAGLKTACP